MSNDIVIAVDVAESVLEVAVSDRPGHVCRRERPSRSQVLPFFLAYPGAKVVMEACGSAHYWGRELQKRGHQVALLPPHHVRPYVRGNKTDRTDAKGILEAYRNADIHPVRCFRHELVGHVLWPHRPYDAGHVWSPQGLRAMTESARPGSQSMTAASRATVVSRLSRRGPTCSAVKVTHEAGDTFAVRAVQLAPFADAAPQDRGSNGALEREELGSRSSS